MDKVRGVEQQTEMFDKNLAALLTPPLRMVFTLPTGVYFGESRADVRRNVEYLYPVRVLNKAPQTFDPEKAFNGDRIGFFEEMVHHRVEEQAYRAGGHPPRALTQVACCATSSTFSGKESGSRSTTSSTSSTRR